MEKSRRREAKVGSNSLLNAPNDRFGLLSLSGGGPPPAPPANLVAPSISTPDGAVVGEDMVINVGTWSGSPTDYDVEIYRGVTLITTVNVPGNTTYLLVQADAGNTSNMNVSVVANGAGGASSPAASNTIARILDALAAAYISGETLTSAEIDSINNLYLDLRAAGYHTEIDRLHIYAGPTAVTAVKSYFGSYTAIPVNSPTFTRKIGYTQTGTSYIRTAYIGSAGTKFGVNDNIYVVGFNNLAASADSFVGGAVTTVPVSGIQLYANLLNASYRNLTALTSAIFATRNISDTYMATVRINPGNYTAYLNASSSNVAQAVVNPMVTIEFYEGGRNLNGAPSTMFPAGARLRYGCNGSSLVNPVTLNTIINNYIASL